MKINKLSGSLLLFCFLLPIGLFAQKIPGLAPTPPMGWNSWNTFATNINEKLVIEIADAMVASGMRDAGYNYLVLDDGWMAMDRDSKTGDLVPDPKKFPGGMQKVVDYVHSKGLKFGLYNCAGTKTCAGYPGTRGFEYQDARYYARLGIDYLKYDWCNTEGINAKEAYATMSKALTLTGKPIVFSLCEWGDNKPWDWATPIGHLWRISGDISSCFDCIENHGTWNSWGVTKIIDMRPNIRQFSGPDHWNDFDMMEVGTGMSESEDRAHFTMWCMLASPLIAGNDVRKMTTTTRQTLTNKNVIAINQDKLGIQAFLQLQKDSVDTWIKPLADGSWAYCFMNRSQKPKTIAYDFVSQPITDTVAKRSMDYSKQTLRMQDVWTGKDLGKTDKALLITIQPHDVVLVKLMK